MDAEYQASRVFLVLMGQRLQPAGQLKKESLLVGRPIGKRFRHPSLNLVEGPTSGFARCIFAHSVDSGAADGAVRSYRSSSTFHRVLVRGFLPELEQPPIQPFMVSLQISDHLTWAGSNAARITDVKHACHVAWPLFMLEQCGYLPVRSISDVIGRTVRDLRSSRFAPFFLKPPG